MVSDDKPWLEIEWTRAGKTTRLVGLAALAVVLAVPAFVILIAVLLTHCAWDKPNPAAFTPTTDSPCGNVSINCTTHGVRNGMCCLEGEICGGDPATEYPSYAEDPRCPIGSCCDNRSIPDFAKRHSQLDAGAK